jgi:hypothetical protein
MKNISFEREALTVLEDGNTKTRKVAVEMDRNGLFTVSLPVHVHEALNYDPVVSGDTLMGVMQQYEADCDAFSRWRLGKMAKPMLMFVNVEGPSKNEGVTHSIGIGLHEVLVEFDDELGTPKAIYERTDSPARLGSRIIEATNESWFGSLFEDTPEVRAKFKELADSINQACNALKGFVDMDALGLEQQFLAISYDSKQGAPAAEPEPSTPAVPTTNPEDEEEL